MKAKLFTVALISGLSLGTANAVSLTVVGIANTTVGFITEDVSDTLVTGTAKFYSTSTELGANDVSGILGAADPFVFFSGLIATGATSPGEFRSTSFTVGNLLSNSASELGDAGNKTYIVLASSDNSSIGVYQGINVPAIGVVNINPSSITEDLVGTSLLQAVNTTSSGFQLAQAVPEPSTLLLSAFGVLGLLLRRKR